MCSSWCVRKEKGSVITLVQQCNAQLIFSTGSVLPLINVPSVKDGFLLHMEVREVCRSLIYELQTAVLFTISLKCVNVLFLSSNDTNLSSSPRDKCVYYNRTTNNIFISAYEGIPENLLLNFLGWLVRSCFHPNSKLPILTGLSSFQTILAYIIL